MEGNTDTNQSCEEDKDILLRLVSYYNKESSPRVLLHRLEDQNGRERFETLLVKNEGKSNSDPGGKDHLEPLETTESTSLANTPIVQLVTSIKEENSSNSAEGLSEPVQTPECTRPIVNLVKNIKEEVIGDSAEEEHSESAQLSASTSLQEIKPIVQLVTEIKQLHCDEKKPALRVLVRRLEDENLQAAPKQVFKNEFEDDEKKPVLRVLVRRLDDGLETSQKLLIKKEFENDEKKPVLKDLIHPIEDEDLETSQKWVLKKTHSASPSYAHEEGTSSPESDAEPTPEITLDQAHISYGLLLWGHSTYVNNILLTQKKVVRTMCRVSPVEHCCTLSVI